VKILLVGAELFRADGQTYMMKLRCVFRNFVKVLKTVIGLCMITIVTKYEDWEN